jgi:hypothetical protein
MATGIMNNEVKQQQAAELAARVAMFLATGGAIKTTKTGRRGRTTVSQVHTPRVVVVEKQRYTWEQAKEELAAIGLLNKQVQSAIKARQ